MDIRNSFADLLEDLFLSQRKHVMLPFWKMITSFLSCSTSLHSPNLFSILHTCRLLKYQCITCLQEHTRIIFLVHGPGNIESCRSSTQKTNVEMLNFLEKSLKLNMESTKKYTVVFGCVWNSNNIDHFSLNHGSLRIISM